MPVPTTISDLSTTAASNYPSGSDSPATLDDVQRAHAGFIAQIRDGLPNAQNSTIQTIGSVSGTDTITGSLSPAITAYVTGQRFTFIAAASNTTAVTLNISGLGAKNVYKRASGGLVALVAKDLISGDTYSVTYDGTQFVLNEQRPYSQGAAIASASTVNLDTATGDYIHVTGTTSITALTLAQGEERTVVFDGILTLTYGASLLLPTGASLETAANDVAVFRGESSSVVRCVQYTRASGAPLYTGVPQIQPISASVAANALTISASQLALDFRSATLTSGTVTTVTGTPANLVISSGSTLGTINATQSRIVVIALNNAGTIELAAVNISGGNDLSETGLISTTAEGGAGGADSATVIYSTTARTNVAYRVIGYIESTQATAGSWATAPSTVQGAGGNALTAMSSLGYGQTWQDVTGSRALATTYYNTTGKPIQVIASLSVGASSNSDLTVNGVSLGNQTGNGNTNAVVMPISFTVPAGQSYRMAVTAGGVTINKWSELR